MKNSVIKLIDRYEKEIERLKKVACEKINCPELTNCDECEFLILEDEDEY